MARVSIFVKKLGCLSPQFLIRWFLKLSRGVFIGCPQCMSPYDDFVAVQSESFSETAEMSSVFEGAIIPTTNSYKVQFEGLHRKVKEEEISPVDGK